MKKVKTPGYLAKKKHEAARKRGDFDVVLPCTREGLGYMRLFQTGIIPPGQVKDAKLGTITNAEAMFIAPKVLQ